MVREQLLTETILVELAKRRHDHGCNGLSETDSLDIVGFSPGIFPIRRPLGFFEGPLIINEIDEGRGWPTNPWPS
jgi:hypothetical protein